MSEFPVFVDERGALVAVEFERISHPVVRMFVVTSAPTGLERGHHRVPCPQTVLLIAGSATFWLDDVVHRLDRLGECLDLPEGAYVRYCLDGPTSSVAVLAGAPYVPHPRSAE